MIGFDWDTFDGYTVTWGPTDVPSCWPESRFDVRWRAAHEAPEIVIVDGPALPEWLEAKLVEQAYRGTL